MKQQIPYRLKLGKNRFGAGNKNFTVYQMVGDKLLAYLAASVMWDIDGTLLNSDATDAHINAHLRACEEIAKVKKDSIKYQDFHVICPPGLTDFEIAHRLLSHLKFDFLGQWENEWETALVKYFTDYCPNTLIARPTAEQALQLLSENGVLQGLATGNVKAIAEIKFKRSQLHEYINWQASGFGNKVRTRKELVQMAQAGASDTNIIRSYLIGDTPADILSVEGTDVIAFGMLNTHTPAELRSAGAKAVFMHPIEAANNILQELNQ